MSILCSNPVRHLDNKVLDKKPSYPKQYPPGLKHEPAQFHSSQCSTKQTNSRNFCIEPNLTGEKGDCLISHWSLLTTSLPKLKFHFTWSVKFSFFKRQTDLSHWTPTMCIRLATTFPHNHSPCLQLYNESTETTDLPPIVKHR